MRCVRCAACQGLHGVIDKGCPEYQRWLNPSPSANEWIINSPSAQCSKKSCRPIKSNERCWIKQLWCFGFIRTEYMEDRRKSNCIFHYSFLLGSGFTFDTQIHRIAFSSNASKVYKNMDFMKIPIPSSNICWAVLAFNSLQMLVIWYIFPARIEKPLKTPYCLFKTLVEKLDSSTERSYNLS